MTFEDLATRVFALYRDADYVSALAVVENARATHPDEDNILTFWQACLEARLGRNHDSVQTLLAGMDRGEWWPTGKLIDHDLDSVRDEPGWETVLDHCTAMTQSLLAERPSPMVRTGTGNGTLVTIQGAHAIQEDVFSIWDLVAPERWTVITPVASEPNGDGGWEWPHSIDASVECLVTDLSDLAFSSPLILNGFSIGSAIACHVINLGRMDVEGLIAIAPSSPGQFDELLEATSLVRSLIICGGEDSRVDRYRALESQLETTEGVDVQIIEGLGHATPDDLDRRVATFLAGF